MRSDVEVTPEDREGLAVERVRVGGGVDVGPDLVDGTVDGEASSII